MTFFQGLVFKWGSLIGISIPDSGANGSSPFVAADVEFTPAGFTGTITDDWATVPYCATDFAPYNNTATDHLVTIHNPTTGVGDICRYMGVIDSTNWRMPTAVEWDELYREQRADGEARRHGTWTLGSFEPLSGLIMGPEQGNVTITSNTQVDNADPYDDGAVFLPASGCRHYSTGTIHNMGIEGYYWSSTASSADDGYDMTFHLNAIVPQWIISRTFAWSIRCIRE